MNPRQPELAAQSMARPGICPAQSPISSTIARWIDAYETACIESPDVELAEFLPPRDDPEYMPVLTELARIEIERAWGSGRPLGIADLQRRFPEMADVPECLSSVAFEEYRQRVMAGQRVSPRDFAEKYGADVGTWPAIDIAGLQFVKTSREPPSSAVSFFSGDDHAGGELPKVGDCVAGFSLLAELGQGTFAKVFLAKQFALAGRYVVLKISDRFPGESQALAQLQHTNIVPIYSQHCVGRLHVICMPFLGSATLADVLRRLRARTALPHSGENLVSTIKDSILPTLGGAPGAAPEIDQPVVVQPARAWERPLEHWRRLERLSYVDAILWVFSRLAAGLEHAHERGVLHRDLKPANVLLRDDGEPMLLDFNLAGDRTEAETASAAVLGGTLPYMAPEQIESLLGKKTSVGVRADIFSLGVMFYEMISGRLPFPAAGGACKSALADAAEARRRAPANLTSINPAASPAVDAIVRRCLAVTPEDRYQHVGELHEDLQRQLENLPLRHAREASQRERFRKWRCRHPRVTGVASACILAGAIIAVLAGFWWQAEWQVKKQAAEESLAAFIENSLEAQFLLSATDPSSADRLRGQDLASRTLERYRLFDERTPYQADLSSLSKSDVQRLQTEWLDLATSVVDDSQRLPAPTDSSAVAELEAIITENSDVAVFDSPHEQYRAARAASAAGEFGEAARLIRLATEQQPQQARYWMLRGIVAEARLNIADALTSYTVVTVLRPGWSRGYVQRGNAKYRQGDIRGAVADYDAALALDGNAVSALVNRAIAREKTGIDAEGAIADLNRAIELAPDRVRFYYLRARLHRRAGRSDQARADERTASQRSPRDAEGWVARGVHLIATNAEQALAAFDSALALDRRSVEALRNKAHVLAERLRRPENAISVLGTEIEFYPDHAPAILGRGVLHARLGRRDAAIADARRALAIDRGPTSCYQAACIYAQTSRQIPADADEAIHLLFTSLHLGADARIARADPDLAPIRTHPDFLRVMSVGSPTALAK